MHQVCWLRSTLSRLCPLPLCPLPFCIECAHALWRQRRGQAGGWAMAKTLAWALFAMTAFTANASEAADIDIGPRFLGAYYSFTEPYPYHILVSDGQIKEGHKASVENILISGSESGAAGAEAT